MIDITQHLGDHEYRPFFAKALRAGWEGDQEAIKHSWQIADEVQIATGLRGGTRRVLTDPEWQHKLNMGVVPSFGLTLYHSTSRTHEGLNVNACASAGDCIKLCVLNNNRGTQTNVQQAWRWRTNMLVHHPYEFFVILGQCLKRAVVEHDYNILCRLNVNSDIEWHTFLPEMFDGSIFDEDIKFYDYTKHHDILYDHPTGWVTPHYRVAYSWNENSHLHAKAVNDSLACGGALAVVTDRLNRDRQPFDPKAIPRALDVVPGTTPVLDADLGDEWMFREAVGDLSFKPRTRALRDWGVHTDFVVKAYGHAHQTAMEIS